MIVKLVVVDNREFDEQFGVCSGAAVFDLLSESLIADDRRPRPEPLSGYETIQDVQAEQKAIAEWEGYHFPNIANASVGGVEQFISQGYLAAMVIGTTGWSGFHSDKGYWQCTFDDLTEEGKVLYKQIAQLYSGCDVHLLTFLDT